MRKNIIYKYFLSLIILVSCYNSILAKEVEKKQEKKSSSLVKAENGSLAEKKLKAPKIYDLVHENLRPDNNEFYLSSVYGTAKNPRALIKRSTNRRAGDLYNSAVEYSLGDAIAENLIIEDVDFLHREVIVKETTSGEYYALKLSYGTAKSRLVKKPDYKAVQPESTETSTETAKKAEK